MDIRIEESLKRDLHPEKETYESGVEVDNIFIYDYIFNFILLLKSE